MEAKYLISACSKIQLAGINPYLFEYALSVVLLHREDTQNLRLPSPATYMPEFYVGHDVLIDVIREGSITSNSNDRVTLFVSEETWFETLTLWGCN